MIKGCGVSIGGDCITCIDKMRFRDSKLGLAVDRRLAAPPCKNFDYIAIYRSGATLGAAPFGNCSCCCSYP